MIIFLINSDEPKLKDLGTRGLAIVSAYRPRSLGNEAVLAAIMRLLKQPLNDDMQLLLAQGLLNLSKEPDNQVLIARKCTFQLLALNGSPVTTTEVCLPLSAFPMRSLMYELFSYIECGRCILVQALLS